MKRHRDAIQVQNASNPSGVARSFAEAISEFMASPEYKGTTSVMADPALRLFACKLADMFGGSYRRDLDWAECEARATDGV